MTEAQPHPFNGKTVAVLGLARSGKAAAMWLAEGGATVEAWDDRPEARTDAASAGISIKDLSEADARHWAALVMSPGIPLTHDPHPVAAKALGADVPVIGDIELLWRAGRGAKFIGITGTNGKSTTTALIGHVLKSAGCIVAVGGNLGIPVLSLPTLGPDGWYVIEMSSFQLDLVDRTTFGIAVLLNLTPDHLDRHGDMAGYAEAKRRLFRNQSAADTAILGIDDAPSAALADGLDRAEAKLVRLSVGRALAGGIYVLDGQLFDATGSAPCAVMDLRDVPTLPGAHNWQNAAACYAACRAVGVASAAIAAGLRTYPGLPHRQEMVGQRGKVSFINDSKATNADAAAKALACYEPIYWIAGGVPKAGGIRSLVEHFPRIARAYLIGKAAEDFATTLAGHAPVTMSGDLDTALGAAAADAATNAADAPVVLLSPAAASYDQFSDYEARGNAFRAAVSRLAEAS